MPAPTPYQIGVVMTGPVLTAPQLAEAKSRLQVIAKSGLPLPIELTVAFGDAHTEKLIEPIAFIKYVQVEIIEGMYGEAANCLELFGESDEVWCFPTDKQGRHRQRAFNVYDLAQTLPGVVARKYKLIPPWIESNQFEIRKTKGWDQ